MQKLIRNLRSWRRLAVNNFLTLMNTRVSFASYLAGKIIRFGFYLLFLFSLIGESNILAGYNKFEVLVFFLTFNFIDIGAQILFRGTYNIGHILVKQGKFDYVLLKPFNPLLHSLSNIVDFIDLATLLVLIPFLGWAIGQLDEIGQIGLVLYALLLLNGLVIAAAFHILAGAVAILTFESHHVMFVYRNLTDMLRFPIDIYPQALQLVMITVVPVGIMIAFPVKALLGLLTPQLIWSAFLVSAVALWLSLKTWNWAVKQYQSASS